MTNIKTGLMSADGVIFNNVYDNGYSNNQVIFSLRDNLKNSTMTHKPTGKIATELEAKTMGGGLSR